jgi:hypothetical protein
VHPKKVLPKKNNFSGSNFLIGKTVFWAFQNFVPHIEVMKFCQNHWLLICSMDVNALTSLEQADFWTVIFEDCKLENQRDK